jgi:hypothetical protein
VQNELFFIYLINQNNVFLDKKYWKLHLALFCFKCLTMSGPPESPLQESFPPSRYPAQTISGQILT